MPSTVSYESPIVDLLHHSQHSLELCSLYRIYHFVSEEKEHETMLSLHE